MHTFSHFRVHREIGKLESSIWSTFISAGSLLLTLITILILFFGVFLSHSR